MRRCEVVCATEETFRSGKSILEKVIKNGVNRL